MVEARPTVKLTYEDYFKTPDDERWELLDGELILAPPPTIAHQRISGNLFTLLRTYAKLTGSGEAMYAPVDVVLSDHNVLQPDLLFISNARSGIVTDANVLGAPDLVVEILSPSTASRDWRVKLDLYASHGVKEYWVVDPDGQRVWVMAHGESGLSEVANYGRGDVLTSPTLSGFSANLEDVFPEG